MIRRKLEDVDFEVEKLLVESGLINEYLYLNELKQRKLYIEYEISQDTVSSIVKNILQYNKEDESIPIEERKPILLYVASNGGSIQAGFEVIDAVMMSKTPVYTINLGYQYSMGMLIGIAGHKRFASEHSTFLIHDGSNCVWDSGAKVQDQMDFNRKLNDRIRDYILLRTKITAEEYDSKFRVEWYMFSDEAKEKGLTDYIIGKDCDIDLII